MQVTPEHILSGLAAADRASLCTFLALYEDATLPTLLWDLAKDAINWTTEKVTGSHEANKAFSDRIAAKSAELNRSTDSDSTLRLRLWMNLRHGFELAPALTFARRGVPDITSDLGAAVCNAFAEQADNEAMDKLSLLSTEYWTEHANRRLNPFSSEKARGFEFPEVTRLTILKMVGAAAERGDLDDAIKSELAAKVRDAVASVDVETQKKIFAELGVEEMSESAAFKLLATGGGLAGLGIAVEMAGFAAYILAAEASAIIPLVGGKTLVSTLAVVASPWFIVPVILGGGVFLSGALRTKMCAAFGVAAATILAVGAVAKKTQDPTIMLEEFTHLDEFLGQDVVREYESKKREAARADRSIWDAVADVGSAAGEWVKDKASSSEYPNAVGYLERYHQLKGD